jgi:hypothetical protein
MQQELMTNRTQELMTNREAENIVNEAREDAGFQKMLKFKKGDYWCDGEEIPLGTVYLAHCKAWTKTWVHFELSSVVERKVYRVALGERAPERDQLPDNDESKWPMGPNGKPQDPWVLQYLLPLEDQGSGDVQIFVAQSFGGRRAISELCTAWGRRVTKNPKGGQPIIQIGKAMMPTKKWGDVPRPDFEVIGWDDTAVEHKAVDMAAVSLKQSNEFNDEIPF